MMYTSTAGPSSVPALAMTPSYSITPPATTDYLASPSGSGRNTKTAGSPSQSNGLPVRTSCNNCRGKKIRCDKTSPEDGGCARCRREGIACCYDVRDPIGRPRKRKASSSELSPQGELSPVRSAAKLSSRKSTHAKSSCCGSKASSTHQTGFSAPIDTPSSGQLQGLAQGHVWTAGSSHTTTNIPSLKNEDASTYWNHLPRFASPTATTPSVSGFATSTFATPSSMTSADTVRGTFTNTQDLSALPPNLSDLGLAAFLESLDTLEIAPEDGLTPSMLKSINDVSSAGGAAGALAQATGPAASSALSFANIGATSYAVPSDMSWSDPAWLSSLAQFQAQAQQAPSSTGQDGADSWSLNVQQPQQLEGPVEQPSRQDSIAPIADVKLERESSSTIQKGDAKQKAKCCCTPTEKTMTSVSTSTPPIDRTSIGVGSDMAVAEHVATTSPTHLHENTRVHCVPNPSGKGCTCLCDVSVALINVRTTLRQARDDESMRTSDLNDHSSGTAAAGRRAASTLQLTLSASQAIAAQCACSASCPTCRSDPSTSLSASLLVSTALQIYIRAVRTLRQGLGAGDASSVGGGGNTQAGCIAGAGSIWDVSIGQYRPKAANAKRIALFAMKLELRDLRDSIAKISRAACPGTGPNARQAQRARAALDATGFDAASHSGFTSTDSTFTNADLGGSSTNHHPSSGINPIDQVVIRKLHQQLGDLLRTVESIEEQQDAERAAMTLSDA